MGLRVSPPPQSNFLSALCTPLFSGSYCRHAPCPRHRGPQGPYGDAGCTRTPNGPAQRMRLGMRRTQDHARNTAPLGTPISLRCIF